MAKYIMLREGDSSSSQQDLTKTLFKALMKNINKEQKKATEKKKEPNPRKLSTLEWFGLFWVLFPIIGPGYMMAFIFGLHYLATTLQGIFR